MKIISKSKDFYDFLQGIYGMDEKRIYKRPVTAKPLLTGSQVIAVYLCGEVIYGYYDEHTDRYYYGEELRQFDSSSSVYAEDDEKPDHVYLKEKLYRFHYDKTRVDIKPMPDVKKMNEKYGQPVGFKSSMLHNADYEFEYPKLKDINFNHYMDAKTIWLKITDWLSPKDVPLPIRPDKEKIVSHGFDYKTSFRKMK
jgi:hypothetical protein